MCPLGLYDRSMNEILIYYIIKFKEVMGIFNTHFHVFSLRHNQIHTITASLLQEVCKEYTIWTNLFFCFFYNVYLPKMNILQ